MSNLKKIARKILESEAFRRELVSYGPKDYYHSGISVIATHDDFIIYMENSDVADLVDGLSRHHQLPKRLPNGKILDLEKVTSFRDAVDVVSQSDRRWLSACGGRIIGVDDDQDDEMSMG